MVKPGSNLNQKRVSQNEAVSQCKRKLLQSFNSRKSSQKREKYRESKKCSKRKKLLKEAQSNTLEQNDD